MALVDNFLGNQHGTSRLMMMQARFQQKQQEEKEQKLFAMIEGQVDGNVSPLGDVQLVPAARTQSNSSNLSQNTSASSNVSLSSSMGSSLVSSLGSTGSGMAAAGGKVRQMFEDRRSQINGRPPVYTKNVQTRKLGPTKGWDRSHPLDPLPVSYERKPVPPAPPQRARVRGVSLERGSRMARDEQAELIRRSKSNYQVDDVVDVLDSPPAMKPKSLSNLLDDNQNPMNTKRMAPRASYNSTIRQSPSRELSDFAARGEVVDGRPRLNFRGRTSIVPKPEAEDVTQASIAAAAAAAAAEATRRLEREKAQIQAEAKRREEQLLMTIKQQQQELQRLQQAAALAEQKAKAAAVSTRTVDRRSRPSFTASEESNTSRYANDEPCYQMKGWNLPAAPKLSPPEPALTAKVNPIRQKPVLRRLNETRNTPEPSERAASQPHRKPSFAVASRDGLVACSLCERNFAPDRIEKHEEICAKTKAKKRKVFDVTKMRVKGTDAETFVLRPNQRINQQSVAQQRKPLTLGQMIHHQQEPPSRTVMQKPVEQGDDKKSDWRKKHESFIEAIRAAKALQKHLKNGGKASDLPPPPPSDTSDYIQCPHCMRRFSPGAADRHIPKCANIKSNKPRVA